MRKKLIASILGILTIVLTMFIVGSTASAKELTTGGLTSSAATITDQAGNVISDQTMLVPSNNYTVSYQWTIPDGETISSGDTATVQIPKYINIDHDTSFPVKDENGTVIGTFSVKAGASTGAITFNDAFTGVTKNRHGTLSFYGRGNYYDANQTGALVKEGFIAGRDEQGKPTTLTWNVIVPVGVGSPVVITDTLGPNQTFIPGSVKGYSGYRNGNGIFNITGLAMPEVEVNGNQIKFTFNNVNSALNLQYSTKVGNVVEGNNEWTNTAEVNGKSVQANIQTMWGGSGHGNGNTYGSVQLTKTDAATKAVLAGAVYDLQDDSGKVLQRDLTTNAEGILDIKQLALGHYQLVETKAPAGYELNTKPVLFTITEETSSQAVEVSQSDIKEVVPPMNGDVILTKTDAANKHVLAGAVYELRTAAGQVVKTDLTTNNHGELAVKGLALGDYQFVETKAPTGYQLNETPLAFSIKNGQTTAVAVSATDKTEPPVKPGEPEPPVKPGEPEPPVKPGEPEPPVKPGEPEPPVKPSEPELPVKPGEPEPPVKPGEPEPPVKPGEPEPPVKPELPVQPASPNESGQTGGTTNSGLPTSNQEGVNSNNEDSSSTGIPTLSGSGMPEALAGSVTSHGQQGHTGTLPQTDESSQQPWTIVVGVLGLLVATVGVVFLKRRRS